jgi:transcriptional regulator GlxA family with amidase domain
MPLDASRADPILQAAIRQITTTQGDLHVNTLAGSLNVTVRRLQRLFKAHVGLSPKQVIRLQRFRSSATNLVIDAPVSWAQVAAERGFSDQSHLIREFTELGGTNPTRLFDQIGKIRHRGLEAGTE